MPFKILFQVHKNVKIFQLSLHINSIGSYNWKTKTLTFMCSKCKIGKFFFAIAANGYQTEVACQTDDYCGTI